MDTTLNLRVSVIFPSMMDFKFDGKSTWPTMQMRFLFSCRCYVFFLLLFSYLVLWRCFYVLGRSSNGIIQSNCIFIRYKSWATIVYTDRYIQLNEMEWTTHNWKIAQTVKLSSTTTASSHIAFSVSLVTHIPLFVINDLLQFIFLIFLMFVVIAKILGIHICFIILWNFSSWQLYIIVFYMDVVCLFTDKMYGMKLFRWMLFFSERHCQVANCHFVRLNRIVWRYLIATNI